MRADEFQRVYPHLIGWIGRTLVTHQNRAKAVASLGFARLPRYFGPQQLGSAKVVAVGRLPMPPLTALGLSQFAAFEHGDYDGITYFDTYFIKEQRAADEPLHFHELIHVIQWRLLGPHRFLFTYAAGLEEFGYRDSPLERMAYDAQSSFESAQIFDAESVVAEQLSLM